jgi:Spy/CpxP family protein refolding chaperone
MAYELGVTASQQSSIDKLRVKATDSAVPLVIKLDRTEGELSALIASSGADDNAVEKLRKKALDLDERIEGVWSQYRQQVVALLRPNQRQKYERLTVVGRSDGCRGYGLSYGRGMGRRLRWKHDGYGRDWGRRW